jgi:hypothetical protein
MLRRPKHSTIEAVVPKEEEEESLYTRHVYNIQKSMYMFKKTFFVLSLYPAVHLFHGLNDPSIHPSIHPK